MILSDEQIKAIKKEGRKLYKKVREARETTDFKYPSEDIPDYLLHDILVFFSYVESIAGYKVVEPPIVFCDNCFFGGSNEEVYDLFTKVAPIKINNEEEIV